MKISLLRAALRAILNGAILLCAAPSIAAEILVAQGYSIGAYSTSGTAINTSLITGLTAPGVNNVPIVASGNDVFIENGPFGETIGEYTTAGATVNAALVSAYTLEDPGPIAVAGNDLWSIGLNSQFQQAIVEWNMSGTDIGSIPLAPAGGLPINITVSGGDVFADFGTTISEWTTSGALVNASLITVTGSSFIEGMAVSGSDIFLTNLVTGEQSAGVDWVSEYTTSGTLVNASLISGLVLPEEIAVYGGNLYVASPLPSSGLAFNIGEYTTSGTTVNPSVLTLPENYPTDNEAFVIVPEPASWVLAVFGLLSVVFAACRR
jgi:hypothetical protein